MSARTVTGLLVLAGLVAVSGAAAAGGGPAPAQEGAKASARALAVRIVLPGGRVVGSPAADSEGGKPKTGANSWSYPADGSVVVTGDVSAAVSAETGKTATSGASASAANVSLFEGEITLASATAHASASSTSSRVGGAFVGTGVEQLQAFGRTHAFGRASLGDWGYLVIAAHTAARASTGGVKSYTGSSVALDVHLTAAHGGLPAGAEVQVGYAQAGGETPPPVVPDLGPQPADAPELIPPVDEPLVGGVPQLIRPPLTASPYVFPVYGPTSATSDYGTSRRDNGWQHGVDLLGGLGQPLVAVATGTLYSVGWNHAAGNRLWLRDRQGNEFLYAHLSAFSTLAANGAHVRAGQVIGFMGDTGNAGGLPTHLHFEVHPVSMLFLGADGAVDPEPYLATWRHMATLPIAIASGWAPKVPGTIKAPEPGAVLLGGTDISTASGLDPGSLRRALRPGANG